VTVENIEKRVHMLQELGFTTRRVGEELHGTAVVTPEMHVPGAAHLRTSVLAIWTDMIGGLLAALSIAPRVPVTLELDVNLLRPAPAAGEVTAVGRTVKAGRSVFVAEIEFAVDGEPAAIGGASFMAAPDPDIRLPPQMSFDLRESGVRLAVPLAERADCRRPAPGVATLPRSEDGLNASNTVNGGLIALVAE
jgi:acyl-coenzyme A thioesterase PaaI-like protein